MPEDVKEKQGKKDSSKPSFSQLQHQSLSRNDPGTRKDMEQN